MSDPMRKLLDELNELVMELLMESTNPRYTNEERERIHLHAKRVRNQLVRLRVMRFDQNTAGYNDAIESVKEVNKELQESIDRINNLVRFIGDLARLVAALDRLIATAAAVL